MDMMKTIFLKKLTVERVPKTDYINVSFSSENPELSAYVANKIGVKFKEFFSSLTSTNTKESLYKLDSLRESKRREVDTLRKQACSDSEKESERPIRVMRLPQR